jgi:DNA end-binding protein Ku
MAPRANWKGFLKFGEVVCPVALYTAASSAERVVFHTINRATGNRVHREFVDGETGKIVERDEQVKGYQVDHNDYVVLEPDEIAAVIPESDKTIAVRAFLADDEIDDLFFDRPYYLAPADSTGREAFVLIRDGMRQKKVAAVAEAVLFRRLRPLLIRPYGNGLIAATLNFDYEVRSSEDAFRDIPKRKIKGEMLDLAKHIIGTKLGTFDARAFDDRYEAALVELVKAKVEGKALPTPRKRKPAKATDLMQALRESAGMAKGKQAPGRKAG